MNKLHLFLFILLLPAISSCMQSASCPIKLGEKIMFNCCKQLSSEHNLKILGSGYGGSPEGKLRALALTLISDEQADILKARKILIYFCESLLKDINSNEQIRPSLLQYPYTGKNLDIMIGFNELTNILIDQPYIALASSSEGKISYSINENCKLKTIHRETYEEALKIYNAEQN